MNVWCTLLWSFNFFSTELSPIFNFKKSQFPSESYICGLVLIDEHWLFLKMHQNVLVWLQIMVLLKLTTY